LTERQKQIQEIVNFVARHKHSHASLTVCTRILGDEFTGIDDQTIDNLRARLPNTDSDELEACYYIIK
jgi:hypothetical protein